MSNQTSKEKRYFCTMESPIGLLVIITSDQGLKEIRFEKQKHFDGIGEELILKEDHPILLQTKGWLQDYFLGKNPDPSMLPMAAEGSDFQLRVWKELVKIPYGGLTTYGAIAKTIAKEQGKTKMSAQAVGGAVGRNPLGILVPCHRVIGTNGKLTGYAGGLDKKIFLLEIEGHRDSASWK